MLGYTPRQTPPWEQTPPAGSRHTPIIRHPPGSRHPLCAVHAGRYGQQAGGTHPTGMHTCDLKFLGQIFSKYFLGATAPRLSRSENPRIDNSTKTCISSDDVNPSASNPLFATMIDDVTNSTFAVQFFYGETMDIEMCKQLEKVLFTYFPDKDSCGYYRECVTVWECHTSRICEFQCSCPKSGNGSCKLDILRRSSEEIEWTICDIRV